MSGISSRVSDASVNASVGSRAYTEQNYVTNGETITDSLDAIDTTVASHLAQIANVPTLTPNTDITTELNDYIASLPTGSKVRIPTGTYLVDASIGIKLKSNMDLELSNNTVLKAIPNNLANYSVLKLEDLINVKVTGGTILGERAEHTGTTGEWGHGINILGCTDVEIKTNVKDCWGDGVYIGKSSLIPQSKNIKIDVVADNNRRQGMSVVSVDNLEVRGTYKNTNGTSPAAGIDLEPNAGDIVNNVKLLGVNLINNVGGGIDILNSTNVILDGVYAEGNNNNVFVFGGAVVSTVQINNSILYNGIASNIKFDDKVDVQLSSSTLKHLQGIVGGNLLFGNTPTNRKVKVSNCKLYNNGKYNFRWTTGDTISELVFENLTVFNSGGVYTDIISGKADSVMRNSEFIMESDFVNINLDSENALYINTIGFALENCKFKNKTANNAKLGDASRVSPKNCTFDQYFNFAIDGVLQTGYYSGFYEYNGVKMYIRSSRPTSGSFKTGDIILTTDTYEYGTSPNKYLLMGWKRITTGSGHVLNTDWKEMRCLTGN